MRLDALKERLKAALQLPACAVQEVASRLGLVDREEREYRAQHEAGHAAGFFLADMPMVRAEISHFRGMTTHYLNTVLDPVVTINAGEVNLSREDERLFAEEHPDRNALMYLAGIASTQDPKHAGFFSHIVSEQLALGRDATWEDIGVPYSYLADRFIEIHSREPQAHEVRVLFHRVNDRMKEVFADPRFARAIQVIKEQIKRRELRGSINSKIRQGLVQEGLSEADFAQMQNELFSIDIDQIVREFHPDEGTAELQQDHVDRWGIGKRDWRSFSGRTLKEVPYERHPFSTLQAMFLGEKPVCFKNPLCKKFPTELQSFGFVTVGDYTYDPKQVEGAIARYPDEFVEIQPPLNAAKVMDFLSRSKEQDQGIMRGLLLGFPLPSVKGFEKVSSLKIHDVLLRLYNLLPEASHEKAFLEANFFTEKIFGNQGLQNFLRTNLIRYQAQLGLRTDEVELLVDQDLPVLTSQRLVDIHGFAWVDTEPNEESTEKQRRLSAAFQYLESQDGHDGTAHHSGHTQHGTHEGHSSHETHRTTHSSHSRH